MKSSKKKAGLALALAAVFGLSAGNALAAAVTVNDGTAWTSATGSNQITADDITITGKIDAGNSISMSGGSLTTGKLIFGGSAGSAGDLAFASGKNLTFTGGKITAKEIVFNASTANAFDLTSGDTIGIYIGGSAPASGGSAPAGIIAAEKLTYNPSGSPWSSQKTTIYLAEGGAFTMTADNANSPLGGGPIHNATTTANEGHNLVMTGGTLSMDGGAKTGRYADFNDITISGGDVTIGGNFLGQQGYEYAALYGNWDVNNKFDISGGTVTLKDWGSIAIYGDVTANANNYNLDIMGGTINMTGSSAAKSSVIRASSASNASDTSTGHYSYVNISDSGVVNVDAGKYGAIVSRKTNMSGGEINVDGTLTVAGSLVFQNNANVDVLSDIAAATAKWGDFNFSGGTINIGAAGLMDLSTGNVTFNAKGGEFSGKMALGAVPASNAAKGTLYALKAVVDAGKSLTVAALDLSKATNASTTLLTVNGNMVVDGTTTITADTVANSLVLGSAGALTANFQDFLTTAYAAAQAKAGTLISATNGATLYLRGNPATYTDDNLSTAKTALGGNVTVAFLDGSAGDKNIALSNTATSSETVIRPNDDVVVTGANAAEVALTGTTSSNTLSVANASAATPITSVKVTNTTLTGAGDGGDVSTPLIKDGKVSTNTPAIEVAGSLNLGIAGNDNPQGGTVGAVKLAATSGQTAKLNVNDGAFKTGAITANGEAAAIAVSGSDVTSEAINLSTVTKGAKIELADAVASTGAIKLGNGTTSTGNANNELTLTASQLSTGDGNIEFGTAGTGANILAVEDGSVLNAKNLTFTGKGAGTDSMTVTDSSVSVNDISFNSTTATNSLTVVGGTVEAGAIKGNATKTVAINVGDADQAGHIVAASVKDAAIILDPPFGQESSTMTVTEATNIDLAVLQNSWFLLDSAKDKAWMTENIPGGKLAPPKYTAALALRKQMVLGSGKELIVDGGKTTYTFSDANNDKATFADGSLLLVDAAGIGTDAALKSGKSGAGTASVATGATLKIVDAKMGTTVKVLDNFTTTITGSGWSVGGGTLLFDSKYITGTPGNTTGNFQVAIGPNTGAIADLGGDYPLLSNGMVGMLQDFLNAGNLYDPRSGNAGVAFVSKLLDDDVTREEAARTLESAARVTAAAAVPTIAGSVAGKLSNLVVAHNNMLNAIQPAYGSEPGQFGLWLNPFYGQSDVDGLEAGQFKNAYELTYGGMALGLDYNLSEALRVGLALNVGGGDSESQGGLSRTENTFDFVGATLYGSWSNGAFDLTGDLGYTTVGNDIEQRTLLGQLEADVDSDVLSLGLTGQYRFAASDNLDITPHLGLRYTKISVDDANLKLNGGRALNVSTDDQSLFQIPVGVKFSNNFVTDGGWTVTPSADLGVLFTTGDTEVDSKVSVFNYPSIAGKTTTEAADEVAFTGALGLKMAADNGVSLNLDYGLLASGNQTDHSISGMLRFEF